MQKKKYLYPIIGAIGVLLVVLTILFPMLSMQPKNIPVGIASDDNGITTPAGEINAGAKFTQKLTETDNPLVDFIPVESMEDLTKGLDEGKYYATIKIPVDFSQKSVTKEAKIDVTLNEGLNAMVSTQLSTLLTSMGQQSDINFEITSINSVASMGLKAMLLPMMLIIMTFVASLVSAFLVTENIKNKNKWIEYAEQLIYVCVMAFAIGFSVASIVSGVADVKIDIASVGLFLSLVSLALVFLTNGVVRLWGKKGLIVPVLLLVLGMGTVQIPYEYLNEGWQNLIASWEPFRYIGNGIREVLFQGHGAWNKAAVSIIVLTVIGLILGLCAVKNNKKQRS